LRAGSERERCFFLGLGRAMGRKCKGTTEGAAPRGGIGWVPGPLPPPAAAHTLGAMERITVDLGKEWLSVADICEYMGVSTFVVTRVLRSGELPAVKFGREWRVSRGDFEDWLNARRFEALARVPRPGR
jgi:excisionase family DNA binding protein